MDYWIAFWAALAVVIAIAWVLYDWHQKGSP